MIPESFLQTISDFENGKVYVMENMNTKSQDYNEGYRDGFNQCLKEQAEYIYNEFKLTAEKFERMSKEILELKNSIKLGAKNV
jgi:hypothetical protein